MDTWLTVADAMTPNPVTLRRDEPLDVARALMVSCGIRHLPVEEYGRLLGLISLCDVLGADLADRSHVVAAEDLMTRGVPTTQPSEKLSHTAERLRDGQRSCFPVLDGRRLVGILARADFVPAAIEALRLEANRPTVAHLMTAGPLLVIHPGDPLERAYSTMKSREVRHLPVVDGERLVGIVSDHDLLAAAARLRELRVREAMKSQVVMVSPDEAAAHVGEQLRRRRFGALAVVRRGRLVGMLTVCDYFNYFLAGPPADAVAEKRRWA